MTTLDLFERKDLGAFDGDELRQQIEDAHLLRAMTDTPGWHVFTALVEAELARWERRILTGTLEPDVYRHKSGYVLGLRHALETPAELARYVAAKQQQPQEDTDG